MAKLKSMKVARWQRSDKSKRNWVAAGAFAALLAICPFARTFAVSAARASNVGNAVPFRAGENLNYRVEWSAFSNAATVQLSIPEQRNLYGWPSWHFRVTIHTVGSVRSLFEIDDQFDSYSDRSTFESRQFEEHLSELGRQKEDVMHFAATGEDAKGPGPMVVVLPGTRDPLAMLYNLRAIDWDHTPEFRAPVYDGKEMYEMRARRENADEPVTVAAGQFSTSRISIELFQYEREVEGMHFEVWLANDAAKRPVLMRADLPFGSIRVELVSVSN